MYPTEETAERNRWQDEYDAKAREHAWAMDELALQQALDDALYEDEDEDEDEDIQYSCNGYMAPHEEAWFSASEMRATVETLRDKGCTVAQDEWGDIHVQLEGEATSTWVQVIS